MRKQRTTVVLAGAAALILSLGACRRPGAEDFAAALPEIPKDIDATLDPKTLATRLSTSFPPPEKAPGAALAPCCGSKDVKDLKVRFPYTKCAPLRDFIATRVWDLVLTQAVLSGGGPSPAAHGVRTYRRGALNQRTVLDTIICVSSDGPWNATLTEERPCGGYAPHDTLLANAFGDVVPYVWNGGPASHPAEVQLVSCRERVLFRYSCGGLSGCTCDSAPCPAEQPCPCGFDGIW